MSGNGAAWDPNDIDQVKQKLESLHKNAGEILKLAADADPEWYVWGLVGAIPAALYWKVAAEDVYEHLEMMGEALQSQVKLVEASGNNYKTTEENIAKALESIRGELDSSVFTSR